MGTFVEQVQTALNLQQRLLEFLFEGRQVHRVLFVFVWLLYFQEVLELRL